MTDQPKARPRWRRRLLLAGALIAVLVLCHGPLFRLAAGILVADDPLETADAVVVMARNGPYVAVPFDELADLYQKKLVREILLIEDRSSRLIEAGVLPPLEPIVRRELAARGVPDKALTVRAGKFHSPWNVARDLGNWLAEHPQATVICLADELDSRSSRAVMTSALDGNQLGGNLLGGNLAQRVRWRALPDRRYGVSDWWHTRQGITSLVGAYVTLLHITLIGEPAESATRWSPDRFETQLRSQPRP